MATATSDAVGANPLDAYTTFLFEQLFNPPNGNAQEEVQKTFQKRTAPDGTITGVLSFREEKTGAIKLLPSYEVAIFCDETRLEKVDWSTELYDSVIEDLHNMNNDCNNAFMYTDTFENKPDVIQMCPWFLQYVRAKKYHTTQDLTSTRAKLAVAGLDKLITKMLYRPIDLLTLWDKCMLHEMMHTKAGGLKDDVNGFSGYGWKNCKKISTEADKCFDNADSFAILGSALYWKTQGREIDDNGKFTSPPTGQTRNIGFVGSGAGRGSDTMKNDAAKRFM
ncbi:uncharacterized protein GGS22DRAFT_195095 [Annulohypoxylon maeteangense]|uniref:uncharacterized protein n=1 Tax=Annulohypoxylon maeteangense TaxID=1927788 RepID=UPI0020089D54|nr:uncharacterized protein GGS22DRAFT_195095 [Annulohypoxylon maeteangense]KAI0883960.1 hypothetical protein GGS22DRAFT_195095 [Annulohypoxylon maeteangense]